MGSTAKILFVDDDALVLTTFGRLVRHLGEVRMAPRPDQALEMLERDPADVVIADYKMPRMNGDVFLERVRQRWPDTVRLLITAHREIEIVQSAIRRGAIFSFLTKPFEPAQLRAAIKDAIAESARGQATRRRERKRELDLETFRQLFRSNADAMMIADVDGYVLEVNDRFVKDYGDNVADAMRIRPHVLSEQGRVARDVSWELSHSGTLDEAEPGTKPKESLDHRWHEVRQKIETEGGWSGQVSDGDRHLMVSVSAIIGDDGVPYAYAGIERDITARHQLEAASRAAQYEVVYALARLAEYRDPETGAHLERMRRYSRLLARHLGETTHADSIDSDYVEAIFYSSPLHDIGKVAIPDAVLLKPGRLDADELVIMRSHAAIGAEVLMSAGSSLPEKSWLKMATTIALQHHEKFDGSGYPAGLAGEQIALSARIVALADAYDAITSRRVYKGAQSHATARALIIEARDKHFDGVVVDAFLAIEDQFIDVKQRYTDEDDPALGRATMQRIERIE